MAITIDDLSNIINEGRRKGFSSNLFRFLVKSMLEVISQPNKTPAGPNYKVFINAWLREATNVWDNFNYKEAIKVIKGFKLEDSLEEIFIKFFPKGAKDTQEDIDKVRASSKKLPPKKLKLESIMEELSKEIFTAPPHYTVDGYKVILTSDINANNYSRFINNFRAGRIIMSGKVSEMNDEFTQELIYKTMNNNKLKIDNNFYYVIFEGIS